MTPETWQKVSEALDQCLDLPAAQKQQFLHKLRAEDPLLCQEVEELLQQECATDRLQTPPPQLLAELPLTIKPAGARAGTDPGATASHHAAPYSDTPVFPTGKRAHGALPFTPTIPGYQLLEKIGQGGMGVVYKARQEKLNRIVALKMILAGGHAAAEEEARFLLEAEMIARLKHPYVVQIHEFGINPHDGKPFFSLEFLEGGSLAGRLKGQPQPATQAALMVEMLAQGMQAAHDQGIVHRDLKPANVLLTTDGVPRITDFGLAKQLDNEDGHTRTGAVMGTPSYMAPEQAEGKTHEIGPAADIYALGAILYEMLTGRPPFKGTSAWDTVTMVIRIDPVPLRLLNSHVPRDLETICLKCLEKTPAKRYGSCAALADDLRRWQNSEPILARRTSSLERAVKWTRRNPWKAVSGSALVLLLAVVVSSVMLHLAQQASLYKDELQRLQQANQVRQGIGQLLLEAQQAEAQKNWSKARTVHEKALAALAANPELQADELRTQLMQRLQEAVQGEKAIERDQKSRPFYNDAIFHETSFTGLELADNQAKTRQAARAYLASYQLDEDENIGKEASPLEHDRRYLPPADFTRLVQRCYELLLLWAEAEAAALPGQTEQAQLKVGAARGLQLLARAGRLGAKHQLDTQAYHLRKARYTAWSKGEKADPALPKEAPQQPSGALDWFLKGLESYRSEQYGTARKECLAALKLQKDHFWARFVLGLADLRLENWSAAKVDMTMCLEQRPDFAWPLLMRGFASSELGALYKAMAVSSKTSDAKAQHEFAAAEADFSKALQLDADAALLYAGLNNRGVLFLRLQRWDDAIADLDRAIKLKPAYLAGYINLAKAYESAKRWGQAIAALDQAVKLAPNLAALYDHRSALHLERNDRQAAGADLKQAIDHWPKGKTPKRLAQLFELRGKLHIEDRLYDEALEQLTAALKLHPQSENAYRLQAECFLALNRREEAAEALDSYLALTVQPSAGLCKARGLIHTQYREYARAIEMYTLTLWRTPADEEAYRLRGWVYLLLDAARPALDDFEEALKSAPKNADALVGRGSARVRLRMLKEAVADAEEALKSGPPTDRLLYKVACIYSLAVAQMEAEVRKGKDRQASYRLALYEKKALDCLQRTLETRPPGQRVAFWHEVIATDPLLLPIRRNSNYVQLAQKYAR